MGKKKSREPESNEGDNNDEFYEYGREIPARLTGKTREQYVNS